MKIVYTLFMIVCSIATYAQAKPSTNSKLVPKPATAPAKASPVKPVPIELTDLDLSTANPPLPLIIKAPKGTTVTYDEGIFLAADSSYAIIIDMSYSDMPKSIAERKKDALSNEVFKVQKFLIDKPDMLMYEVKYNGKPEYHFELAQEIRGEKYFLHDKWITDKSFTQKEINTMLESAKSLRVK